MVEQAGSIYLYIKDASPAIRFLSAADEVEWACTNRGPGTAFFSRNAHRGQLHRRWVGGIGPNSLVRVVDFSPMWLAVDTAGDTGTLAATALVHHPSTALGVVLVTSRELADKTRHNPGRSGSL